MNKTSSSWEIEENARGFLEHERGAVPGEKLQLEVIRRITGQWLPDPSEILDLGCGDGILGRFLLENFPSAKGVFVDFSDPMLEVARGKLGDNVSASVLNADFASPKWVDSVSSYLPFDIVISGFAIHHQPDERKKELYGEIYKLLCPGGVFLNLEHVRSSTPEVETLFEEFYTEHLHSQQLKSDPDAKKETAAEIYRNRPDKDEDKLTSVETQCEWLREIGFNDVDCFFKLYEIALFGGRK